MNISQYNIVKRSVAALTLTALVAACGGGSESSDTTERSRNSALWTATSVPSKMVVFGTQDGFVQAFDLPVSAVTVSPFTIAEVKPNSLLPNAVVSVAADTAQSEIVYAGVNTAGDAYITRTDLDGNSNDVFTAPNSFAIGMGYDPASRTAVLRYNEGGVGKYILHEVDSVNSPIFESAISYYMVPAYNGKNLVVARGDGLRDIDIANFKLIFASSDTVSSPADVWAFAADTQSDLYYGARQQSGQIVSMDMTKTNPITKVENVTNPAALAVFSDGMIVAGTGQEAIKTAGVVGAITLVDPTGASSPVTLKGVGTTASSSGVQSVWAVESPIANALPRVSLDSSGVLTCSDATWRADLPLSRLSRSPISSVREYTWFLGGDPIAGVESETFVPTEAGKYSCAVTAVNMAGTGQSDVSTTVVVEDSDLASTTSTTTTVLDETGSRPSVPAEAPGSAESAPTDSPVVTIPTVSPGTPVAVVTPSLRSAKWTFKGRTAKVTFRKFAGAKKYRLYVRGATRKNIVCKSAKTTVTCTTTGLRKGINTFSAKALSTSGVTVALSTKTRLTK